MPSKKKKYNARFPPVSYNFTEPVLRLANVSKLYHSKLTSLARVRLGLFFAYRANSQLTNARHLPLGEKYQFTSVVTLAEFANFHTHKCLLRFF